MLIRNYSEAGWRLYIIPDFTEKAQRDGYNKLAKLEKRKELEVMLFGNKIYIRDRFESRLNKTHD